MRFLTILPEARMPCLAGKCTDSLVPIVVPTHFSLTKTPHMTPVSEPPFAGATKLTLSDLHSAKRLETTSSRTPGHICAPALS